MGDSPFVIRDSGKRKEFPTGMVRDIDDDKARIRRCFVGPMLERWATHLHKGVKKYPDIAPGVPNWTLAETEEELARAIDSAMDHAWKWERGWTDEDHAAAMFFNVNLAEYCKLRIEAKKPLDKVFEAEKRPYVPKLPGTDPRDLPNGTAFLVPDPKNYKPPVVDEAPCEMCGQAVRDTNLRDINGSN